MTYDEVRELFDYRDGGLYHRQTHSSRAKEGTHAGYVAKLGYRRLQVLNKRYSEHTLVFLWHHGFIPDVIDHINRDPSDNRIENLRAASYSENLYNTKRHADNKTGCKNVSWHAPSKSYRVEINAAKKYLHLGYFKDLELADLVAQEARDLYHGRFAHHG